MTLSVFIGTLGAASIGFVLGWTLYFANRGKSGDLSVADIAAIAGVIAGSTVIGFLDGFGIAEADQAYLFGGYGIGVFIGFMTYFGLYRASLRANAEPGTGAVLAGLALQSRGEVQSTAAFSPAARALSTQAPAAAPQMPQRAVQACITAGEALQKDLATRRENASDPNHADYDLDEYDRLTEVQDQVRDLLKPLYLMSVLTHLTSDAVQEFITLLESETKALKTEADRLKTASTDITELGKTFETLTALIEEVRNLT